MYNEESLGPKYQPICGITALAIVTKSSFEKMKETIRVANKKRSTWTGRLSCKEIETTLSTLQVEFRVEPQWWGKKLRDFYPDVDTFYIVHITDHFMAYRNGLYIDQVTRKPARFESNENPWVTPKRYIKKVWKILAEATCRDPT